MNLHVQQKEIVIQALTHISDGLLRCGHEGLTSLLVGIAAIIRVCKTEEDALLFVALIERALMKFSEQFREVEKAFPSPALPPHIEKFIDDLLKK